MADINEAINCVQNLIIAMSCYGSTCESDRNSEVGRLENLLDCLAEERKSADEMFRELGYTVNRMNAKIMSCDRNSEHIVINAGETGICAAKFVDTYKTGKEVYWPGMTLSDTMPTQHTVPLDKAERMALARLIEELEESE